MTPDLRYVGSASKSVPVGSWQKAVRGRGSELQLEELSKADALAAFDACMRERKAFLLETTFGNSTELGGAARLG